MEIYIESPIIVSLLEKEMESRPPKVELGLGLSIKKVHEDFS